jgi:DNA-binding NarL/FixJ family response regulator
MTTMVRRALIVDQWALVRLGIAAVLAAQGIEVVGEAQQGREVLDLARSAQPDVLVLGNLDRPMLDVVTEVAALNPRPKIALLVSTPDRVELAALLAAGADALLVRSVDGDELAAAVARLDSGERVIAPALLPLLVGALSSTATQPDSLLTAKEREVLGGLAAGRSNQEIADSLFVTRATVKTHLAHIYAKLDARDRHEAVAKGVALGLLT